MTKEFGIVGNPVKHSFSPEYFYTKFRKLKLPYVYHRFELTEIGEVLSLVRDNPKLAGFNVTSPFKQEIIPFLSSVSDEANEVGAVNTVVIKNGELHGFNTDIIGFNKVIGDLRIQRQRCLILGTGGASRAVIQVLNKRNMPFIQVSRNRNHGMIMYGDITNKILCDFPVIINTTPLGMQNSINSKPSIPYHHIDSHHVLIDLIYNPRTTVFLHEGLKRGARIKNGYQMLIEQAEASWKIWASNL
jgi:shikimate dehydrogenase